MLLEELSVIATPLTHHVPTGTIWYMSPDRRPRIKPEIAKEIDDLKTPASFEAMVNHLLVERLAYEQMSAREVIYLVATEMLQVDLKAFDALVGSVRDELQAELEEQAREDEWEIEDD